MRPLPHLIAALLTSHSIGPDGAVPYHMVSTRDRFSHYGLLNMKLLDGINPTLLPTFDIEFVAKCREWLSRLTTTPDRIADINAFFARYGIILSTRARYKQSSMSPAYSIGDRMNYAIASSSLYRDPKGSSLSLPTIYWMTLQDVICYRGLQDKM